jgi:hypothetical protein
MDIDMRNLIDSHEFEMPPEEASLLVEFFLIERIPLWVSIEQVANALDINREQARKEMERFAASHQSYVEWKIFSNGAIGLKVKPAFLDKFTSTSRNNHVKRKGYA